MGQPTPSAAADSSTPSLPARYYLRLAELLVELGVDLEALLNDAKVAADRLLAPSASLSLDEVQALSLNAARLCGRADLGLQLGRRLEPASHDVLGLAMQQAPTLDAALRLAARYFSLLSPGFRMRYHLDPEHGELAIYPRLAFRDEVLRLHLDTVLAAVLTEINFLNACRLQPLRVDLGWPRPDHHSNYNALLGITPAFSALPLPGIQLQFAAPDLLAPRDEANQPGLLRARQRCEATVQRLQTRGLADWTQMMLRHAAHSMPNKRELAALLGMSERSFTRRLAAEGCSFRQLSLDYRLRAAEQALTAGDESLTALAHRLGYSDGANFTRAFRRRYGRAPRDWRR
ncbi:AraC family transcriptional regulator [Pseudomarimonas arenosa]|uniref:AraC family transcriptional regulator ligand-binding domain-containing protein n=1 Tax=Pseudomarimonas arenosa TaxID=2774145 RepID=A0AAW3ZPB5_9GAMM|nr:AraC family transcriptional regulator [Pseudomarimonas arenosa]MBD8526462.1 AraC family transcriptional regulator ligand-binding domain-containing protein [Pseudomarimonas arenosa]